jgi:hypothetical protein
MDSAAFLRGVRSFLRFVTLLAQERCAATMPSPPIPIVRAAPLPIILRGPIVPPARTDLLPADFSPAVATCECCGTRWQPRRGDFQVTWLTGTAGSEEWSGVFHCPICNCSRFFIIDRFIPLAGRQGRRGWMIDRLTGRKVRYGRDGWEERTDG